MELAGGGVDNDEGHDHQGEDFVAEVPVAEALQDDAADDFNDLTDMAYLGNRWTKQFVLLHSSS
jgi:hypothetical protein